MRLGPYGEPRCAITTSSTRITVTHSVMLPGGPGLRQRTVGPEPALQALRERRAGTLPELLEQAAELLPGGQHAGGHARHQHAVEPVEVEGDGPRALHRRQHHEEREAREQQQLQLADHVRARVGRVVHRVRQQRVEQSREAAEHDAGGREEQHRRAHVPGRVGGAQPRVLVEEHEPRELDARVQEHAGRGRREQVPHERQALLGRAFADQRLGDEARGEREGRDGERADDAAGGRDAAWTGRGRRGRCTCAARSGRAPRPRS